MLLFRVVADGETKRDERDLWPDEAVAVDLTIRRAARQFEAEENAK